MTETKQRTAALYARFSSDIQGDQSIDRQFADLEKAAKRLGLRLDKQHYYADRGKSGSSLFERPGLTRELCDAARSKKFDIVLVEATDRLSRRKADLFWLADVFKFASVEIWTPKTGVVSDLQLLFDAHQNEDFIAKLSMRIKSGHDLAANGGRLMTPPCYGYDAVFGKPGERTINEREASVVRRIFTEYANGMTPRQIVASLARDKISSPTGGAVWNYQGIVGGVRRGLIRNRLYVGEYVKNRYATSKNPETGKRISRKAADEDLIVRAVPHLRIIDQALWDAAHAVREGRAFQKFGASGIEFRPVSTRRKQLLSGLLRCGECSSPMSTTASSRKGPRMGCSSATYRKTCNHTKTYDLEALTSLVVVNMVAHLADPEFLKRQATVRAIEFAKLMKDGSGERQAAQKQLDRLNVQIARLVAAIEDSDQPVKELIASIKAKEAERVSLQERLRFLGADSNVTVLHPAAMKMFGKNIETLHAKLRQQPDDPECRLAFSNIVDSIVVHPTANGEAYEVSLYARLSAINGGVDLFPAQRSHKEIVAAEAYPRVSGQAVTTVRYGLNRNTTQSNVILLGRWRVAA